MTVHNDSSALSSGPDSADDSEICPMIGTMNVEQAVELKRCLWIKISTETERAGIRQGVFPYGDYVELERGVYVIYEELFIRWVKKRICKEAFDLWVRENFPNRIAE